MSWWFKKNPPVDQETAETIFKEVAIEVARNQYYFDPSIFTAEYLKKHFRIMMQYVMKETLTTRYDSVLVSSYHAKVDEKVYPSFMDVVVQCKGQLGIEINKHSKDMLDFNVSNVKAQMEKLGTPKFDIDEKVRLLLSEGKLSAGVYR